MRKLIPFFIGITLVMLSASSFSTPVRYYFTGEVSGSSFGYEGKSVEGWYQYDFDTYNPADPYLANLFSYNLKVGNLDIIEGSHPSVVTYITYFDGAVNNFRLTGETPYDQTSGLGYAMDVFELAFSDNRSAGTPEAFIPNPSNLDLGHMHTGNFEIYGHAPALLPDGNLDVFWLRGSLTQISTPHDVPESSSLMLLMIGLSLLVVIRLQHRR